MTMHDKTRQILIDNIRNCNSLSSNAVVSAICGLCHLAKDGDEQILLPLIEHNDKSIAAAALSSLCFHFGFTNKLLNRIIQFASKYPSIEETDTYELQRTAIFILSNLAKDNTDLLRKLIEIADNYHNILGCSDAALMNANVWESLAELCGLKIKGCESTELYWNPHSAESELIRNKIRRFLDSVLVQNL
jgi:hypothetical protein